MDLNSEIYNGKQLVTKKLLLEHISDLDIYNMYMDGKPVVINASMLSPLRKEKSTSFGFFVKKGEILFNDFVLGGGDCIRFVELLYNCSYTKALAIIVRDFKLEEHFLTTTVKGVKKPEKKITQLKSDILEGVSDLKLGKKVRKWNINDKHFWTPFGISLKTLRKYNVEPISHVFVNDKIVKAHEYAYCFKENKDGYETYKIYQPFSKDYKWLNNHNDTVWQGWQQLPAEGTELIITKSLKDVMAITENLGIPAVSLQAESVKPKSKIIEELKSRFFNIYLLYDNDYDKETNWGQVYASKLKEEYKFLNLVIPSRYESKDYSDLIKNHGKETANEVIKQLMGTDDVPF